MTTLDELTAQVKAERDAIDAAGGYAFPKASDYAVTGVDDGASGMTLRDYFAAKAMNGLCSYGRWGKGSAELAYEVADAMLAARERVVR